MEELFFFFFEVGLQRRVGLSGVWIGVFLGIVLVVGDMFKQERIKDLRQRLKKDLWFRSKVEGGFIGLFIWGLGIFLGCLELERDVLFGV